MDGRLPITIFTNFSQILCDAVLTKQYLITEYKHSNEVEGSGPKALSGGLKKIITKNGQISKKKNSRYYRCWGLKLELTNDNI